jgi:hypothetical protein
MSLHYVNFARFPAIWTIVFAILAESNALLSLAVAAIAVAQALILRQIALRTENFALHDVPSPFLRA